MRRLGIRERARVKKHRRGSASSHAGGASLVSGKLGRKKLDRWFRYSRKWADQQLDSWQERCQHLAGTDNSESSGSGADGHSTNP